MTRETRLRPGDCAATGKVVGVEGDVGPRIMLLLDASSQTTIQLASNVIKPTSRASRCLIRVAGSRNVSFFVDACERHNRRR